MSLLKSFISAFLMYSQIPVPQVEWKEENRRYSLCFFPIIGLLIGFIITALFAVGRRFEVSSYFFAACAAAVPVIVTGGIHLDGFCDVVDAKACFAEREKLFSVMSDPHVGSFAVIKLVLYFILQTAFFSEIKSLNTVIVVSLGFVMSRALSGLAAVTFKCAKKSGTLQSFVKPAHRMITIICEIIVFFAASVFSWLFDKYIGGAAILGAALSFLYYKVFSYKKFGGITGDLAGYFLQVCELSVLFFAVIAEVILRGL